MKRSRTVVDFKGLTSEKRSRSTPDFGTLCGASLKFTSLTKVSLKQLAAVDKSPSPTKKSSTDIMQARLRSLNLGCESPSRHRYSSSGGDRVKHLSLGEKLSSCSNHSSLNALPILEHPKEDVLGEEDNSTHVGRLRSSSYWSAEEGALSDHDVGLCIDGDQGDSEKSNKTEVPSDRVHQSGTNRNEREENSGRGISPPLATNNFQRVPIAFCSGSVADDFRGSLCLCMEGLKVESGDLHTSQWAVA